MPSQVPRPLIPTARASLSITAVLALFGMLLGLVGTPSPSLPAFSIALPSFDSPSAAPPADNESLRSALPKLDDVLPLSRDLVAPVGAPEALTNARAAAAWPDASGARGRLDGWGRVGGYQTAFVRPLASTVESPVLQVWSDVSVFRSVDGARDALRDTQERLTKAGAAPLTLGVLGDASVALSHSTGSLTTYHVLIRRSVTTAWLTITGLSDGVKLESVERLAKTVAERLG